MTHRYFKAEEWRKLRATLNKSSMMEDQRDIAWMTLAYTTGMRSNALVSFTCGDARRALRDNALTLRGEILKKREEGEDMHLPLHREARKAIIELLKLRSMLHSEDANEPLLFTRRSPKITDRALRKSFKKHLETAGLYHLSHLSPHSLRHSFARRVIDQTTAKEPLPVVSKLLGHKNLSTTMIYASPSREALDDAISEVNF